MPARPRYLTALRFWFVLGLINFGGPAGQIALMHEQLVERRRWIDHARFMHALNYCMVLPGPEAMQLAAYVGWLLHGTRGALAAGILFILPGAMLILALSAIYAVHGDLLWVRGLFSGLAPAVVAIIAAAVPRLARRALHNGALITVAVAAFAALFFFGVPFPLVVTGALITGLLGSHLRAAWFQPAGEDAAPAPTAADASRAAGRVTIRRSARVLLIHLLLWAAPLLAAGYALGWQEAVVRAGLFFSVAALVTFGGAYAVLSYVAQAAVVRYEWLTAHDMTAGLGLAESTPGPLILVVQFVGFLAGYNHPPAGLSPLAAAVLGAGLTLWVTFVPCFLWILLGAPYVERLRGRRWLDAAFTAVTAAVVGVITNLAVWLALRVLFREVDIQTVGPVVLNVPVWTSLDPLAAALAVAAFVALTRLGWNMLYVIAGAAGLGVVAALGRW